MEEGWGEWKGMRRQKVYGGKTGKVKEGRDWEVN